MTGIQNLRGLFLLCFSIAFLLLFAAIPSFILSGLNMSWKNLGIDRKLSFWKKVFLGILGGFAGEIAAIAVLPLAESKWCRNMSAQGSHCDGQGPLVLIFTVPLCAILGSCASMLWTWISVGIPAHKPWASIFSYSGRNRALNVAFAVAIQALYWAIFALATYLQTRNLL